MPDNSSNSDTNDFAVTFIQHAKGRANDEATAKLKEIVEAVNRTGKSGKITIELTVKPVPNIPGTYSLEDKITHTPPKEPRKSMWFAAADGGLTRDQPGLYGPITADTMPAHDGKSAGAGRD
uniref:Head-to-tail stopper n=1 Tax=Mycobacterium phage Farewell TaxID=3158893 RepID=A0AAU8GP54_9CAUD